MKNLTTIAQITDSNHRGAGSSLIEIALLDDGSVFSLTIDGGNTYYRTCKQGESFGRGATSAPAGLMMFEMETANGTCERAWVDAAGKFVHLD